MKPLTKEPVSKVDDSKTTSENNEFEHDNYINLLRTFNSNQDVLKDAALHSKYLSPETINLLEHKNLPKEFLKQAQKPKSRLVRDLQGEGFTEEEISNRVSKVMELFVDEYEKSGKVTFWKNLSKLFLNEDESEDAGRKISPVKDVIFKYIPSPLFNLTPEKPDNQELERELSLAKDNLAYAADKQKFGSIEMVKNIDQIINRLSRIRYNLKLKVQELKK